VPDEVARSNACWVEGNFGAAYLVCFTRTLMSNGLFVYYDVQAESCRRLFKSPLAGGGVHFVDRMHYIGRIACYGLQCCVVEREMTAWLQMRCTRSVTGHCAMRSSHWAAGRCSTTTGSRHRRPPTGRWSWCSADCAVSTTLRCSSRRSSPLTTRTPDVPLLTRRDVIVVTSSCQ